MGLILGSASFTRFMVNGEFQKENLEEIQNSISRFAFRNLDDFTEEERSVGWVNILNMFETDFEDRNFFKHPYIALSLRVDVRNVPRKALKQYCVEAENELKQNEDLEVLSKRQRRDIKEWVSRSLLKRAIPRSNTYDMVWNTETSMLYFGAVSTTLCDEFAEYFLKTFDLTLSSVFPYSLAYQILEDEDMNPELLDGLRDSSFVEVKE